MTEDLELHVGLSGEKAFAASVAQMTAAVARMEATIAKMPQATTPAAKGIDSVGNAAKSSGSALTSFGGIAAGIAAAAFGALVTGAAKSAIAYETLSVQMAVLLKDAAKVPAVLKEWKQFSDLTPMEPEQVNRGGKQLLAFGVAVDQVIPKMRVLGDIASGSGKDFNELIAIYGKAKAAGKVQGEILQQLVEGGINILPEFAKLLNVSQGEVAKLGSDGKLSFELFDQALRNMTASGSLYGGMMDKMSQSTEGLISSLKGELDGALREVGMALLPFINDLVKAAIPAIQQAIPYIQAFGKGLIEAKDAIQGYVSNLLAPLKILVTSVMKAFGALAGATDISMSFGDAIKGLAKLLEPAQKIVIGFATAIGAVIEQVAGYLAEDPLFQAAISAISAIAETVVGWFDAIGTSAPWAIDALETVVAVIYRMINPLQLVWDLWGAIFGDGNESIGGLAESTKGHIQALTDMAKKEFGATSEQVQAFAKSFQTAELAGLSTAEATDYMRARFAAFMETCNAVTGAATDTANAIGAVGGKAAPAVGSIAALNAELSKLKAAFEATGDAKTRLSIGQDIAELESTIERVTAQGAPLDTLVMKTNSITDSLVNMTAASDMGMRSLDQFAKDAAASFTSAEPVILTFSEKMQSALGEGAWSSIKSGLQNVKSAFMDFGASAAQSIGYAIGAGESLADAFRQSLNALLVEVPKLVGMALLNAAAAGPPSPASLPMAAAGLALLGLSGILKGVQDKNANERKMAIEGIPASASGGGAPGGASGGFAGLATATQQQQPININLVAELDGVALGGLFRQINRDYDRMTIKNG